MQWYGGDQASGALEDSSCPVCLEHGIYGEKKGTVLRGSGTFTWAKLPGELVRI